MNLCYCVILLSFVGIVLVLVLVLEATVLETSLDKTFNNEIGE